jgi:tagatose 6-phosphate kinase
MILCVCLNPSIDTYAWIDNIKLKEVNRLDKIEEFPGGKAVHVALALKELGTKVTLMGIWAGSNGSWLTYNCNERRIDTIGISVKGNNRKCFTIRSKNLNLDNTEILEPGPTITPEKWEEFVTVFSKVIKNYSFVNLSGSCPKGAPEDAYQQLVKICNEQKIPVMVDCSGVQLKNVVKENIFGIHLNQDEAAYLVNSQDANVVIPKLQKSIKLIAYTKGKDGLFFNYKNTSLHANTTIPNIVSTVGSGDCLTAGILYALANNLPLASISKYGVACAAANCINEDLGMLTLKDVAHYLTKVEVKENANA